MEMLFNGLKTASTRMRVDWLLEELEIEEKEFNEIMSSTGWNIEETIDNLNSFILGSAGAAYSHEAIVSGIKNAGLFEKLANNLSNLNTMRGSTKGFKGFVFEELHAVDATLKGQVIAVSNDNSIVDFTIKNSDGSISYAQSRNINFQWLDKVAEMFIMEKSEEEIREELNEYLSIEIKSAINLRKTREILMNIWARDIENIGEAKELAIKLYKTNKKENKLLAHWSMTLMAYPVFADICNTIGKMESRMFDITNKEIKNRMFDLWGERSTLYHSIDKNIKTLKDINVLAPLPKNRYEVNKFSIDEENGLILIAEILTFLRDKLYLSIDELNSSTEFFPFEYYISLDVLEKSKMFLIDKFGGEMVVSRKG